MKYNIGFFKVLFLTDLESFLLEIDTIQYVVLLSIPWTTKNIREHHPKKKTKE